MAGFIAHPRAPLTFSLRAWSLNLKVQLGLRRRRAHITLRCVPFQKEPYTMTFTHSTCLFSLNYMKWIAIE